MLESSDSEIWDFVLKENLIIITKDEAFQMRATVSTPFPRIIWVRLVIAQRKYY